MVRFIVTTKPGVTTAIARAAVMDVEGVVDAAESQAIDAVIISADPGARSRIAALPQVDRVFDDIQAIPQVASREETQAFLDRVKELRGEENVPSLISTVPTDEGDLQPDGGQVGLPVADDAVPVEAEGPVTSLSAGIDFLGVPEIHDNGTRGGSVIAVVVDTGVCVDQISEDRRLDGVDLSASDDPWDTEIGPHGSMTAGILAGGPETVGVETGVLPEADVFPIKSTLAASELIQAQDIIIDLARNNPGRGIIVNNSWAFTECRGLCDHPVTSAVDTASQWAGVVQVMAAGNQAEQCGQACDGSTVGISGPNSLDSVITVGASGRDGRPDALHSYSSRGGAGASCGSRSPTVTAPVFGEVPWGCDSRDLGNGGGTSAATPQVAGVAGLFLDRQGRGAVSGADAALSDTATQFRGSGWNGCSGFGNVQAASAVEEEPFVLAGFDTGTVTAVGVMAGLAGAALRQRLS